MKYAPLARIILRYLVGAGVIGSSQIGEQLAADPDLIMYVSLAIGAVVEWFYLRRNKAGT